MVEIIFQTWDEYDNELEKMYKDINKDIIKLINFEYNDMFVFQGLTPRQRANFSYILDDNLNKFTKNINKDWCLNTSNNITCGIEASLNSLFKTIQFTKEQLYQFICNQITYQLNNNYNFIVDNIVNVIEEE